MGGIDRGAVDSALRHQSDILIIEVPLSLQGGCWVQSKGATGRDAMVCTRERDVSSERPVAKHYPWSFRPWHNSYTILGLLCNSGNHRVCSHDPLCSDPIPSRLSGGAGPSQPDLPGGFQVRNRSMSAQNRVHIRSGRRGSPQKVLRILHIRRSFDCGPAFLPMPPLK